MLVLKVPEQSMWPHGWTESVWGMTFSVLVLMFVRTVRTGRTEDDSGCVDFQYQSEAKFNHQDSTLWMRIFVDKLNV